MSSTVPTPRDLMGLARDRAMAEAAEWRAMLEFRDAELTRIEAMEVTPMRRHVERSAIAVELGMSLNLSPGQVVQKLATAERLRDRAPLTWWAFGRGRIDAARAREISLTLERLERPESHHRLDGVVVSYASSHTVVELRAWLRRFVARVEADLAIERANAEREKRHVEVVQVEDGMAWLNAYLPAHQAAAIQTRLKRSAKALGADDDRSTAQRQADLLVDALLNNPVSDGGQPSGMKIDIGVLVEADALTRLSDGHAESADGSWEVPSEWIIDSALVGDAFWHRLLVDPITGNTLAHDYPGYQPPDVLRRAITLRDGTCAAPGCTTPASRCDLDHEKPWPDGPTSGENLRPRCRRDHSIKGHGVLEQLLARHHDARTVHEAEVRRNPPRHQTSLYENQLARWLTRHQPDLELLEDLDDEAA